MRQNASGTTILTDHLNNPTYIKCRALLNDMCYTFILEDNPKHYIKIRAVQRQQHWDKTHYPKNESHNDMLFLRCITVPMFFSSMQMCPSKYNKLVIWTWWTCISGFQ